MKPMIFQRNKFVRPTALAVAASMVVPTLVGCGGGGSAGPSSFDNPGMNAPPPGMNAQRPGMSTKQKMVMLAGAAALYYMYKRSQNRPANANGQNGRYFLSKNGRVYYRDMQTGKATWVTPPRQPIAVPYDEAQQYSGYSGYNNNPGGQGFGGYGSQGGVPVM